MHRSAALVFLLVLAPPASAKPDDFDGFWDQTKRELAAIPPAARFKLDKARSDAKVSCYRTTYASLDRTIHAWYCRPARAGKYPAVLISPWYGQAFVGPPIQFANVGVAALSYQGRGYDVDQSSYPLDNVWYILAGIDRPETWAMRGLVAHSLRGLDVLASRPEVDAKRIAVMGASQGGGLSLLVAGLDPRVSAVAADFPFLSAWDVSLQKAMKPPYSEVRKYIREHPTERDAVLRTVSYFDALDVADRIKVPVLVQVGLKDRTCPPAGISLVYQRIASENKRLKTYPKADHNKLNEERWTSMVEYAINQLGRR